VQSNAPYIQITANYDGFFLCQYPFKGTVSQDFEGLNLVSINRSWEVKRVTNVLGHLLKHFHQEIRKNRASACCRHLPNLPTEF